MKFKPLSVLPLLFLCSCSMNNEFSEVQPGTEEHVNMSTAEETVEVPFNGTMEPTPDEQELSPAEPLKGLNIQPSDYFTRPSTPTILETSTYLTQTVCTGSLFPWLTPREWISPTRLTATA